MLARFEYWLSDEDEQWYFHLLAPNGGILVQSAGFISEMDCLDGIEMVRRYVDIAIIAKLDTVTWSQKNSLVLNG
jgi:uncharacterized protein YegP (UPF0339 family)